MDEPTGGLDPLMEAEFRACVAEQRQAGRTVLLSSHLLAEVEAVCDRVTIVRAGRTVETGTLAELRHVRHTSVSAETASPPDGLPARSGVFYAQVAALPGGGALVQRQVDTEHLGAGPLPAPAHPMGTKTRYFRTSTHAAGGMGDPTAEPRRRRQIPNRHPHQASLTPNRLLP